MISEGPFDTEEWGNVEFSFAITWRNI